MAAYWWLRSGASSPLTGILCIWGSRMSRWGGTDRQGPEGRCRGCTLLSRLSKFPYLNTNSELAVRLINPNFHIQLAANISEIFPNHHNHPPSINYSQS
jgi:hypothetical protein